MRNIIIIAILSVLVSCSTSEKKELKLERGIAVVEGKVTNYENSSKVISFTGNSILGDISQTAIIDSLGNFRTEIKLLNPQNVALYYENRWANLYLKPNDSLFLDINVNLSKQDDYPHYEVSGSNPSTTENIRDFYQFHGNFNYEPKYGDSVSVNECLNTIRKQLNIEDSILTEFSKQYKPNEEFMNWAKMNTKYRYSNALLLYYWHFDVNRKQHKPEIFDTDLLPADNDSAIVSGNYIVHLKDYLRIKYYMDPAIAKFAKKKDVSGATTYLFDKLLRNEKPSLSRDILLYKVFLTLLELPIEHRDILWKRYEHYISSKELIEILKEKKRKIEEQGEKQETTLNLKLKTKSETIQLFWETISKKHKDKIFYIDIWATWCGPCREETPYAFDLQNYFEDKQVAFVNLCLASSREDWEKFLIQHHIKGDNYFFNEDETKLLREELKFHGYPTYMIIDKNGALINKNAPRPSSGDEIINILKKLLNR